MFDRQKLLQEPYQVSHFLWGPLQTVPGRLHLQQSRSHDHPEIKIILLAFSSKSKVMIKVSYW